ncbi:MAG: chromate transporter [Tidjanibacter sp.]|nr:chromate transporter [Tidjanibacter sp.]
MIYLQLFLSYLKIGFFGFGGGYAMISLIYNEVVVQNGWLTAAELADVAAISQMTPGPIAINCATYVGFEVTGNVWGSLLATIAVCLPSLSLMMLATHFYLRLRGNKHFEGTIAGMMPMMIGLILSSALMLFGVETFIDWKSWVIFLGCFVASVRKVNPIVLILLSAVVGIIIYI